MPAWEQCPVNRARLHTVLLCIVVVSGLAHTMSSVEQKMPPDLRLEFQIADIGQRADVSELTENLYLDIVQKVDEKDIYGVQVVPQRWPRKVQIMCAHQTAKDCLMIRGIDIVGRHIELNEPGQGLIKITISDAPLDMDNSVIKDWVAQYGTVTEFRNEHVTVRGRRTNWRTGNRYVYVRALTQPVPPSAKIKYGDRQIPVTVWHYGQTHMKCRYCHEIVPKDHTCEKAPSRRCYDCGSESHTKKYCTVGKACFRCGDKSHISRDCTVVRDYAREYPELPARASESRDTSETQANHGVEISAGNDMNDTKEDSVLIQEDMEGIHDHKLEVLLVGGSNCRDLILEGDDQIVLKTTSLIEGGLKIEQAAEKLEELTDDQKKDIGTVVVHVGSCDFPAKDDGEVDNHYTQYVELMNDVASAIPHANIVVSSVLPRAGSEKEEMNKQIELFNSKIRELAEQEINFHFCDNTVHFNTEQGVVSTLYRDVETFGLHINGDGKKRLASAITEALKEIYFAEKLASAS